MSGLFSGRSGLFAFLLVTLLMIVSVGMKYVNIISLKPASVRGELEEMFDRVADVSPMSLMKAEFLREWGAYRSSDECSGVVAASRMYSGNGFEGDVYIVSYTDSIEFPGLPTLRIDFRIEKSMRRGN